MKMYKALLVICLAASPVSWVGANDGLDDARPVITGTVDHLDFSEREVLISDRRYTFAEVVRLNGKLVSGATVPGVLREGMEIELQLQEGAHSVIQALKVR
ncbi:MAG: hypothetical protein CL583_13615 [Alteromonadaceae bacterium]|nr:hypothetical protein [Alteromonadaceae bacterium]|tara:strand:+ start:801 stop:1103 length:303 start_codon:yes stop_codon:yes gene_type:complete